jgi:lysophospholipase L1-like esterase
MVISDSSTWFFMLWVLQTLLLGCAFLLGFWVGAPSSALAGIAVLWVNLVIPAISIQSWKSTGGLRLMMVWACSVVLWFSALWSPFTLDFYLAVTAWLIAAAVWLAQRQIANEPAKARWKTPVMAWLFCGAFIWLGSGYSQNRPGDFYGGLFATLAFLVLWRAWFRLGAVRAQMVHTAILLVVGLPVADLLVQSLARPPLRPETCRYYYSYKEAKGDPEEFAQWLGFFNEQVKRLAHDIFMPAPDTPLPFRLRPNSHGFFLNCPISINSKGFRGREFPLDKGQTYRIIVLGESTTFGCTLEAGETPWPELLEELIRERLKTRRPVVVINAGVPIYSITDNLYRLPGDILPLKPDLIISYHGANGFNLIDSAVLPPLGPPLPIYRERPLRLAAQAEHRLKMMIYRRRALRRDASPAPTSAEPLKTSYAAAYRQLIECARNHGIRLALANYSMAVNTHSEQSVIDFYQGGGSRAVDAAIRANVVHSLIVEEVAKEDPKVCLVDTHPHLDGEDGKFIDTIHFTQEGRRQMAENVFAGIRKILLEDLGEPDGRQ